MPESQSRPPADREEVERAQAALRSRRYRARHRDASVMLTVTPQAAMLAMTRTERDELAKVARLRAKVAKSNISVRQAELLADVEAKLSAEYEFSDEAWADVTEVAEKRIAIADEEVAKRCDELGIPRKFRPGLRLTWHSRGENGMASRRVELRRLAVTRLDALAKAAKLAIETREAEVVIELLTAGLASDEARAFLESIPSPEQLMEPVSLATLEAATTQPKSRWLEEYA